MRERVQLGHKFVEFIPRELEPNTVYVSIPYSTAIHSCCCGCGNRVVTPLSPADWRLIFDGRSVSLEPSIGNWSFPCRSHYWIRNNRVIWSDDWTESEIDAARRRDARAHTAYYDRHTEKPKASPGDGKRKGSCRKKKGLKSKIKSWFEGKSPPEE
jgi:hypothetical protein